MWMYYFLLIVMFDDLDVMFFSVCDRVYNLIVWL